MWEAITFELTQALTDDFLQTLQSQRQFSNSTLKSLFCGKMIKQFGFLQHDPFVLKQNLDHVALKQEWLRSGH